MDYRGRFKSKDSLVEFGESLIRWRCEPIEGFSEDGWKTFYSGDWHEFTFSGWPENIDILPIGTRGTLSVYGGDCSIDFDVEIVRYSSPRIVHLRGKKQTTEVDLEVTKITKNKIRIVE